MTNPVSILCINGSDSTGRSGIQSDIKTIKDLGGYALTAVTSVTVQNGDGIQYIEEMPTELVAGQIRAIYRDEFPRAVKVGMIDNPGTISTVRNEIVGCRNIVCSPGILSSHGGCLMSNESIHALCHSLIPVSRLLMLKCTDAEIILGRRINTDDDMLLAAKSLCEMGAEWVLLRGGTYNEGRINALLYNTLQDQTHHEEFFSSLNIEGWQRHGVGGTLSTAIATRLALGDDVPLAVKNAHAYLHNQVLYASGEKDTSYRPNQLYDDFLSLVSDNYRKCHDVAFYAEKMSITSRYLSQITNTVSGQSPKQIIDSYILQEAERLLSTTSLNIQEAAFALGFSSQMVFAKFFKNKKGCSPTAFRQHAIAL